MPHNHFLRNTIDLTAYTIFFQTNKVTQLIGNPTHRTAMLRLKQKTTFLSFKTQYEFGLYDGEGNVPENLHGLVG